MVNRQWALSIHVDGVNENEKLKTVIDERARYL